MSTKAVVRALRFAAAILSLGLLVACGGASPAEALSGAAGQDRSKATQDVTSGGVIDACVAKDGAVRIVAATEQCKSNETHVQWNVVGPQGPAGPQGNTGPQGPSGTTIAYDLASAQGYVNISPPVSYDLPAGKYVMIGTIDLTRVQSTAVYNGVSTAIYPPVTCRIGYPGGVGPDATVGVAPGFPNIPYPPPLVSVVTVMAHFALSAPGKVSIECSSADTGQTDLINVLEAHAIQVNDIVDVSWP